MNRGLVVAASLLLVTGLASCTQDEPDTEVTAPTFEPASSEPSSPEASPSEQASPEPSETPTVAAPPLPELATQQTPEGAVAFTEWWFETLNYATATGDTEGLRAASDPGCETCMSFIDEVDDAYTAGGSISGGKFQVRVDPAGALEPLGVRVPVFADVTATDIKAADGSNMESLPAEQTTIIFTVLLADDGWLAGGLA